MRIFELDDIKNIDKLIHKYNVLEIEKFFLNNNINKKIDDDEIDYLLECGIILASSNKYKNRERALKIATLIPRIDDNYTILVVCRNILYKLKNFATIGKLDNLITNKYDIPKIEIGNKLSIIEQIREQYEIISNTVDIMGKEVTLNNTQYDIFNIMNKYKNISISAPTSIGKSYILTQLIFDEMKRTKKSVVYVVPTRALINQVINNIKEFKSDNDFFITSSSDTKNLIHDEIGIFVLTQERLFQLSNSKGANIGTLIVDEAQNIMEGSRGVLLEYSIKYAKQIWKNMRVIYLSPLVNNPEKLLENNGLNEGDKAYNSNEYSVRQNMLKLTETSKGIFNLKLNNKVIKENIDIGKYTKIEQNMANVYSKLNNGEKSIIYCNTPSSALKVCNELYLSCDEGYKISKDVENFANFIENYIHKNYKLVKYLKRGIAFHYGNLPAFVRGGIEDLAKDGKIDTIVCTSTLLQGINIPAQNIYIFNPRKGRTKKSYLSNLEFWNLVGRAGRMGFDLSGNIILVQFGCWEDINKYDETKKHLNINYATDLSEDQVVEVEKALIDNEYINKSNIEFIHNIESGFIFDYISSQHTDNFYKSTKINTYIEESVEKYKEIEPLLIKLMGIKPQYIQKVWDILKLDDKNIEEYIIPHPYKENFEKIYIKALKIINENIIPNKLYVRNQGLIRTLSVSSKWIKGKQMKEIIFHKFKNFKDEDKVTETVSSQVDYLNSNIRYLLVKGVYAYQEILKEYLLQTNREKMIEKIPNIPMYLEFGACDEIVLELISLGLMRELAIDINRKLKIDKDDIISSLKLVSIEELNLNPYSENKLKEFIKLL